MKNRKEKFLEKRLIFQELPIKQNHEIASTLPTLEEIKSILEKTYYFSNIEQRSNALICDCKGVKKEKRIPLGEIFPGMENKFFVVQQDHDEKMKFFVLIKDDTIQFGKKVDKTEVYFSAAVYFKNGRYEYKNRERINYSGSIQEIIKPQAEKVNFYEFVGALNSLDIKETSFSTEVQKKLTAKKNIEFCNVNFPELANQIEKVNVETARSFKITITLKDNHRVTAFSFLRQKISLPKNTSVILIERKENFYDSKKEIIHAIDFYDKNELVVGNSTYVNVDIDPEKYAAAVVAPEKKDRSPEATGNLFELLKKFVEVLKSTNYFKSVEIQDKNLIAEFEDEPIYIDYGYSRKTIPLALFSGAFYGKSERMYYVVPRKSQEKSGKIIINLPGKWKSSNHDFMSINYENESGEKAYEVIAVSVNNTKKPYLVIAGQKGQNEYGDFKENRHASVLQEIYINNDTNLSYKWHKAFLDDYYSVWPQNPAIPEEQKKSYNQVRQKKIKKLVLDHFFSTLVTEDMIKTVSFLESKNQFIIKFRNKDHLLNNNDNSDFSYINFLDQVIEMPRYFSEIVINFNDFYLNPEDYFIENKISKDNRCDSSDWVRYSIFFRNSNGLNVVNPIYVDAKIGKSLDEIYREIQSKKINEITKKLPISAREIQGLKNKAQEEVSTRLGLNYELIIKEERVAILKRQMLVSMEHESQLSEELDEIREKKEKISSEKSDSFIDTGNESVRFSSNLKVLLEEIKILREKWRTAEEKYNCKITNQGFYVENNNLGNIFSAPYEDGFVYDVEIKDDGTIVRYISFPNGAQKNYGNGTTKGAKFVKQEFKKSDGILKKQELQQLEETAKDRISEKLGLGKNQFTKSQNFLRYRIEKEAKIPMNDFCRSLYFDNGPVGDLFNVFLEGGFVYDFEIRKNHPSEIEGYKLIRYIYFPNGAPAENKEIKKGDKFAVQKFSVNDPREFYRWY